MSIYTIYRICIWLPIIVPAALILVVNLFGLQQAVGVVGEMIAYSLIWGGLPYAALAVWAMRRIDGRPEADIKRLMFRAPLLMVAIFVPLTLLAGLVAGQFAQFAGVASLGAAVIMLLGYTYVGVTLVLRLSLGSRASAA